MTAALAGLSLVLAVALVVALAEYGRRGVDLTEARQQWEYWTYAAEGWGRQLRREHEKAKLAHEIAARLREQHGALDRPGGGEWQ